MFNLILKVADEAKKTNTLSEFAKFQKDFAKYEKSASLVNEKTKKEKLFGRNYKTQ
jgi:hypothetical protein